MFHSRIIFGVLFVAMGLGLQAAAQESQPADLRLEEMTRQAGLLKMKFLDQKARRPAPQLVKSPLLRCNDPTRAEVDGSVWLWTERKRPVAITSVLIVGEDLSYEHSSLSDEALEITGRPDWTWAPQATKREWTMLDDAVPETPIARQRVLRGIAEKFDASEYHSGQTFQLRLLPRPIYTYADPDHDVMAGALLALVNGTNPEVLVQIEARQSKTGKPYWQVAFARLTAAEASVQLGENEIWKVPAIEKWSPREPYYSVKSEDSNK